MFAAFIYFTKNHIIFYKIDDWILRATNMV